MTLYVTAKVHPDIDGVASILAYTDLLHQQGEEVIPLILDTPQPEVFYFSEKLSLPIPVKKSSEVVIPDQDRIIIVDGSSLRGMHPQIKASHVVEVIDHRMVDYIAGSFPLAHVQLEEVGAAATLVVERAKEQQVRYQHEFALLLTGAIHHNTLHLHSTNTTPRDHQALAYLAQSTQLPDALGMEMFLYADTRIMRDLSMALRTDRKEYTLDGQTTYVYQLILGDARVLTNEMVEKALAIDTRGSPQATHIVIVTDIIRQQTRLWCIDTRMRHFLSQRWGLTFADAWLMLPSLLLRKQILAILLR